MVPELANDYAAVIVAVNHKSYLEFNEAYFDSLMSDYGILVDIKGIYRNNIKDLDYYSL